MTDQDIIAAEATARVMSADPVRVAWLHYGQPMPAGRRLAKSPVTCCRCGAHGPGYLARGTGAAVSDGFSDWDRLPWRERGDGFCAACTWVFATRDLRVWPHLVAHDTASRLTPAQLRDILTRPLRDAVSVPISMQKHVAPWMRWGHVATDNAVLPWGDAEAQRMGAYLRLHTLGIGPAALAEPAPRFADLAKLDRPARAEVMGLWPTLAPWRDCPPYLDVAARAVRKQKEEPVPEETP